MLSTLGAGRFEAHSAGSMPTGRVHPCTMELLTKHGHAEEHLRSKSWDEFARLDAPVMDVIITVCDKAAGEVCPLWPGRPATAHWGFEDPAACEGQEDQKRARFERVYYQIRSRIERLVALPAGQLDPYALRHELKAIG